MNDLAALRTAMQDVTAIVHMTGEEDLDREGTLRSHIQDTTNLITAAQETDTRRFIYLSHIGADRASAYPPLRVRGETEAIVRASELDFTILQAPLVYGAEDYSTNMLVMIAKVLPFVLPVPDAGMSRFQPLWITDLTMCVLKTLDRDDLIGQTIPLGGPEHFTFEQMTAMILSAAGMRRRLVRVKMPLMHRILALADALTPRNPVPSWWLDLITVGDATDLVTIPRNFGFEPHRFEHSLDYVRRKRPWRRDLLRFVLGRL
jgi:NADH dehydrogenase